jgi:hypothetical protein
MGFKLPGKSIASGTSAHRSALKMVAEQRAASALKATASPVKKDWATASKNDPNLSDYVKTRKGLEKGSAEWGANQYKINKAYYGEETAKRLQDKYNKKHNISASTSSGPTTDKPTIKEKGETKKTKIQTKADTKKSEVDENVSVKEAKSKRKEARKTFGRGSAEHAQTKVEVSKARGEDMAGAKGGKKATVFGKLRRKLNKKRTERLEKRAIKKGEEKDRKIEADSPAKAKGDGWKKATPKQKKYAPKDGGWTKAKGGKRPKK